MSHLYMESEKKKKLIDTENRQVGIYQRQETREEVKMVKWYKFPAYKN